jgi:phosphate:Na+ symporter
MVIISFLISLAGATMLLLFAVRMVRTGIERSFGASFKRLLTENNNMIGSSITGVILAVVLQSSAAVTLLVTGFAASGYLAFPVGLSIVLGGDLGSALIIQILSFRLDWLVPVLLTIGGWLFVKIENRKWRQMGRILLGIAFILISLQFLRAAVEPIRDSAFLPAIASYLARDFITAFLVGASLAFVMHSSVAAILMCVTLTHIGALPFAAALSILLGANLGSAIIPIWHTRGMPLEARRIPFANLILRGAWAIVILLVINKLAHPDHLILASAGQSLVYAHIAFNLTLLLLVLPFSRILETPFQALFPAGPKTGSDAAGLEQSSALDETVIANPRLAIASIKRELLRMLDMVERMFIPVPEIYKTGDKTLIKMMREQDAPINAALSEIRSYVASLPMENYTKPEAKIVRGLMEYAIRLETAGDVISKRLTAIAAEKRDKNMEFSSEGFSELVRLHEAITANLKLASNVLISDDLESARLLVMEKTEIKHIERKSRKRHLKRLQEGRAESFETSDLHLETLSALRDINAHISAVAYPILYRNGQLLETRLIQDMDADAAE